MQYIGTAILFLPYVVSLVVFINYLRKPHRPNCLERADLYMGGKYKGREHLM